jgi:hypothetical protein
MTAHEFAGSAQGSAGGLLYELNDEQEQSRVVVTLRGKKGECDPLKAMRTMRLRHGMMKLFGSTICPVGMKLDVLTVCTKAQINSSSTPSISALPSGTLNISAPDTASRLLVIIW